MLPGVPATISRSRVIELIEALGFDTRELAGLEFQPHAIFATVFADAHPDHPDYLLGMRGHYRFTADGETAATHRLCIPILREE
ncbi:hypothetical protein GCM10010182_67640 [Actinomadura cremea]|nr:hypothetical protein GCM10010182_67640 [Actinomadura cremea]